MKKIVFWIVTFLIVLAGISAAVYQWEFVAPPEGDPGYEQALPNDWIPDAEKDAIPPMYWDNVNQCK